MMDATMQFAVGAEIRDLRSQSPLVMTIEKRKQAESGDGSQQSQLLPPPEKRNRGETNEPEAALESSFPPMGRQGGCKCNNGKGSREQEACGCKGERKTTSFDELPPSAREYFARLNAKHGGKIVHRPGDGIFSDSDDEDDKLIGKYNFFEDPWVKENLHIEEEDKLVCCSNPFKAIDFKKDTKLYDELKVFGEKALAYFNPRFNQAASLQDIVRVTACPASCRHHLVTMKAKEPPGEYGEFWLLVIRGKVREGFPKALPSDFVMLQYTPDVLRDIY